MSQGSRRIPGTTRTESVLVTEDGSGLTNLSNEIPVSNKMPWFNGQFPGFIPTVWRTERKGPNADVTVSDSMATLQTGTEASASTTVISRKHSTYISGVGMLIECSVFLGDLGSAGNKRTWGYGTHQLSDGYFFQLDGTQLKIIRMRDGVLQDSVNAADWNLDNSVSADLNGHIWGIEFLWLGVSDIIFYRDGKPVHRMPFFGTDTKTSILFPTSHVVVNSTNTTTQAASRDIKVACGAGFYLGADGVSSGSIQYMEQSTEGPIDLASAGGFKPVLTIRNRKVKNGVPNRRSVRFTAVDLSNDTVSRYQIVKNAQITGTYTPHHKPLDPDVAWAGMTNPLIATLSGGNATGSGYVDNDAVAYQITALGALGETLASTSVNVADVGSPKKQVDLDWEPITYAASYAIYRQVGGVGNFEFIGTSLENQTYIDNADETNASITPPLTNTAEGDSFVEHSIEPTTVVGGQILMEIEVGEIHRVLFPNNRSSSVLAPGETLSVLGDPSGNGDVFAVILWEEDVTT